MTPFSPRFSCFHLRTALKKPSYEIGVLFSLGMSRKRIRQMSLNSPDTRPIQLFPTVKLSPPHPGSPLHHLRRKSTAPASRYPKCPAQIRGRAATAVLNVLNGFGSPMPTVRVRITVGSRRIRRCEMAEGVQVAERCTCPQNSLSFPFVFGTVTRPARTKVTLIAVHFQILRGNFLGNQNSFTPFNRIKRDHNSLRLMLFSAGQIE